MNTPAFTSFSPPTLPNRAMPGARAARLVTLKNVNAVAGKSFDEWNDITGLCPESRPDKIENWLRKSYRVSHGDARAIVTNTDVACRVMPDDFINAVFGSAHSLAGAALRRVKAIFLASDSVQCVPISSGLMLKGRIVFSVIRPALDGIVVTTTKLITTSPERRTTTRVDHVSASALDDPLDDSLVADLRAGAQLSADAHHP